MLNKQKKAQPASANKKADQKVARIKKVNVDIVTGKALASVFFDPSKSLDCTNSDYDWIGENLYIPACVVKEEGGVLTVSLPSGEVYKMTDARRVTDNDDEGVDDILKLRDFSEMSLIHTLRIRYYKDEVYTFVGPILVSLNPYKRMKDSYNAKTMESYHGQKQGDLPPHLFVLAENAYTALMNNSASTKPNSRPKDQTIIISGESGAGKTEATKFIMSYLARITAIDTAAEGHKTDTEPVVGELEQRVLNTNPILEAFGNARTLRNDNSSRFGKFIKIQFTKCGRIAGATIEKYLLEKTRLIHQTAGERNYHIFYQMLRGATPALRAKLHLSDSIEAYEYVSGSVASASIPNVSDHEEWALTTACMESIGIDAELQLDIFRLLSSILHLGNVAFDNTQQSEEDQVSAATAETAEELRLAAELLGFEAEDLLTCLTKQNMYVGGATIVKVQSFSQAMEKKNSFAKTVYSMLFSWLVDRINTTIAPTAAESAMRGYIGLLDIYGFENFENLNSFEQLLINYANEKMQSHFNTHIFQIEQALYEAENIDWTYVEFKDNQACVDLIDSKINGKSGIFQTLDDSCGSGRQDINANFLFTLNQLWSGNNNTSRHPHYVAPRFNSDQRFGVLHYAGEVFYEIDGFAEKNRDSTNTDMKELMSRSGNTLLCTITDDAARTEINTAANATAAAAAAMASVVSPNRGKISKKPSFTAAAAPAPAKGAAPGPRSSFVSKLKEDSISKQFTTSLKQLFLTLEAAEPHFVRCVKPNTYKRADFMNAEETLLQLKNAGMMETIRIRQQGYALRISHKDCFHKYKCLSPDCNTLDALVVKLSKLLSVSNESWQVGTTKIFIRRDMSEKLDRLLWLRYSASSRAIQKMWRVVLLKRAAIVAQSLVRMRRCRKRFLASAKAILRIQTAVRAARCMKKYRVLHKAVRDIQRLALGRMARLLARKLRNPYNRMSYQQLTLAMRTAQENLITCFADQDFVKCAEIEASLVQISVARNKLPLPDVTPTSREEVELFVLETQFATEDAHGEDNHAAVKYLAARMQKLVKCRADFPTAGELAAELEDTRAKLASAMERKEFKRCGALQQSIAHLEAKIAEMASSPVQFKSLPVAELLEQRNKLEASIAAALEAKDFDACSTLQVDLDRVAEILANKSISLDEARAREGEYAAQNASALKAKDFLMMAQIALSVAELNAVITAATAAVEVPVPEPVEEVVAVVDPLAGKTYEELAADIATANSALAAAVLSKDYAQCEELEKQLVLLSAAQALLPVPEKPLTRADLTELIKTKEAEITAALQGKQYAQCDALNLELEALQAKLEAIPTAAKIQVQITELEEELKKLIAAKQYSKCPELEKKIEELKPLHAQLLADEPAVKSPGKKVTGGGRSPLATRKVAVKSAAKAKGPSKENFPNANAGNISKKFNFDELVVEKENKHERPVSKLRPKAPITALDSESILDVAKKMALSRVDAALLLDAEGALSGIITDNDVTRRVIAASLAAAGTAVSAVMTKGPKCVKSTDPALDALEMMVDNHFRHLPVMDEQGVMVGLLDIAKCLYDAISVLEKVQGGDDNAVAKNDGSVVAKAMTEAMKKAAGGRGTNKTQLAAIQAMMEQMFGGEVPTLRTIIGAGKVQSVLPSATITEASKLMAELRKGVLVMDAKKGKELLGILTPKDLLNRVVAKGLSPDDTLVSEVMTPNPDCVTGDLTLLDALREMYEHKYLHLPVREADGRVIGIVDVMELVCSTAGGSGGKGWRDFFSMAADGGRDTDSDTASNHSRGASAAGRSKAGTATSTGNNVAKKQMERPVSKLRPKAPITALDSESILDVAKKMALSRVDAALLLNADGALQGILTDNDVTRRVVSQFLDPSEAIVSTVMTKSPKCVQDTDSALDALEMMVDNHFRHLPVMDEQRAVVGLLDIAKCLYDAISILEKVQGGDAEEETDASAVMAQVMTAALLSAGGAKHTNNAQVLAMQAMMAQVFGGSVPTLRTIIGTGKPLPSVRHTTNIREACAIMTEHRKGLLVLDEDEELVGIITPKDILTRVIAADKSPDITAVSSVMTPNPDCVTGDLTLLDALREMYEHKYLHLPVREADGRVIGIVDVMELVCSTAGGSGGKGWRDFFSGALAARGDGEMSETASTVSALSDLPKKPLPIRAKYLTDQSSDVFSLSLDSKANQSLNAQYKYNSYEGAEGEQKAFEFDFKVTDGSGYLHKIRSPANCLSSLRATVALKLSVAADQLLLKYIDEEGDEVVIGSDAALLDAVHCVRAAGGLSLKVSASVDAAAAARISKAAEIGDAVQAAKSAPVTAAVVAESKVATPAADNTMLYVGGGVLVAAVVGIVAVVLSKKK